ncbi:hypothetical protein [Chryseolinea lacunae]|uniref:Lipoprotein n=1 Tax=Chryseolinea lacunae TaxID=2801331 RepID=A0ABS1L251_9BACT|nr:hypothetical protein [Chryseolinea lacunae]MBL0745012.1 hypothetical protein [Chryseolinea lacunae]
MNLFIRILLISFSILSCQQQSTNEQKAMAELDRLFSVYCLSEHSNQISSQDVIIFSKRGRWAQSYYLVLKRNQNNISVTYHEVDIYQSNNPEMLFFQGISFFIDSNRWNEIVHQCEALLNGDGNDSFSDGILDATEYILSYGGKARVVNAGADAERFEEFAGYLKGNVIDPAKKCRMNDCPTGRELQVLQFLRDNNLPLKNLKRDGFRLHFNCDSALFLKGIFGDSIKIWTASRLSWYELDQLMEHINKDKFGKSQYINAVRKDGRVELVEMHETTFVRRNDSIYQMSQFIKPKLIFHPDMFLNGRNGIKLDKKFNYEGDSIVLGRRWVNNNLNHYYIIIENQDDGEPTAYSFTFDENLKFIYWEDCDRRAMR